MDVFQILHQSEYIVLLWFSFIFIILKFVIKMVNQINFDLIVLYS